MATASGNVGLAFGLVIAAGACTCLGAALVFFTNLANPKWLSGSLGASAGVMIYVSFVEILAQKAVQGFQEAGHSAAAAQRYACFAFFGGLLTTWLLSKALDLLSAASAAHARRRQRKAALDGSGGNSASASGSLPLAAPPSAQRARQAAPAATNAASGSNKDMAVTGAPGAAGGDSIVVVAGAAGAAAAGRGADATGTEAAAAPCCPSCLRRDATCDQRAAAAAAAAAVEADPDMLALLAADKHSAELQRMGLLTALAVGLHNLPEGVATFAAAMASPAMGVAIAIAIALHNIPEGVAVALPVYYATGSRWRAFAWSALSGAAEPLGGLIGYAVLSSTGMSQLAFGVLFAYVAGMMVYISIRELLPTALRYDPDDSCATACAFWGMAIMASSLLLFKAKE